MNRRRGLLAVLFGVVLSLACVGPAFATTVITQPDAVYLSATNKIDFSSIANGTTTVTVVSDSLNSVFFDMPMGKGAVPGGGWSTWSAPPNAESASPDVLYSYSYQALNMQLGQPVKVFGFEIEPDTFMIATETVVFRMWMGGDVVRTLALPVNGSSGARLFAVSSDVAFSRVEILAPQGDGFAIAQLRYALPTKVSKVAVSPHTPRLKKTATFSAQLTPGAAVAGGTATLNLYHRETKTVLKSGRRVRVRYWRLRKTVGMSVSPAGKLLATAKLSYSGSWKMQVSYSGTAGYVPTSSSATFSVR